MADHRDIYRLQRARFDRLADEVSRRISVRLRSESIRHFITFRSKHPDDVAEKITRKRAAGKSKFFLLRAFRNPLNVRTIDVTAVEARGLELCSALQIIAPEDATVLGLGWAERRKQEAAELLADRDAPSDQSGQLVDALRSLLKGSP